MTVLDFYTFLSSDHQAYVADSRMLVQKTSGKGGGGGGGGR